MQDQHIVDTCLCLPKVGIYLSTSSEWLKKNLYRIEKFSYFLILSWAWTCLFSEVGEREEGLSMEKDFLLLGLRARVMGIDRRLVPRWFEQISSLLMC